MVSRLRHTGALAPLFVRAINLIVVLVFGTFALGTLVLGSNDSFSAQAILRYDSIHHPVVGYEGMVVSQRKVSSKVGAEILAQGGNAVDAAVAVGFSLAVTLPRAGNIGGGGFMLVSLADEARSLAIDFRERAPAGASKTMFLNADGNVDSELYRYSHRAVGVPGTVAGLLYAHDKYGSLPLKTIMAAAIKQASEGIIYDYDTASAMRGSEKLLRRYPQTERAFFVEDHLRYKPGSLFRQPELAETLRLIAAQGRDGFYKGATAELLVAEMERGNGLITLEDLAGYQVSVREPVKGKFQGYDVISMPPPSSGGVHLIQMLNILEQFPLKSYGQGTARSLHLLAETMKLAYADRSKHLGDPDFYEVPVNWLTSKRYAIELAEKISLKRARRSADIAPGVVPLTESEDTTHFSVMDKYGNAVATTYTLNFSFGAGIMVAGAGFLLNNEMADFSAKPGVPDAFGLLGGEANAVAPHKRPLSAMTPTMLLRDGKPVLITGSPGGSKIITSVLQHIVNVAVFEMNVSEANHAPRVHHQWYPEQLSYETGVSVDSLSVLEAMGHPLKKSSTMGSIQAIYSDGENLYGSADSRRPGAAAIGVPMLKHPAAGARD